MGRFRALRAWQEARRCAALSDNLWSEPEERVLAQRWRRTLQDVLSNLAESAATRSATEFRRHLRAAADSLEALEAILLLGPGRRRIRPQRLQLVERSRRTCARMVAAVLDRHEAPV